LVLTDDNFKSIVSAVEEGRSIFDNIQNVVHYLLSCNAGEVLLMFFAAVVGWPVPLAAIQILWINLVTDGLPALALALEPPDREIMRRPPRPPREPVLTTRRAVLIVLHGVLIAVAAGAGFWIVYGRRTAQLDLAQTTAFCIVAFSQLFFSFACRSDKHTLPQLGLLTNPHLLAAIAISGVLQAAVVMLPFARPVFDVAQPPDTYGWLLIAGLSLAPVTIVEVAKLVLAGARKPKPTSSAGRAL
jgi:Ca2+-transporting ATPase